MGIEADLPLSGLAELPQGRSFRLQIIEHLSLVIDDTQDQGIRSRNIRNGWSRREEGEAGAATPPVAGPSGTSSPGPATPSGLSTLAENDNDDDDESSMAAGPSRSSIPGTPATETDNDLSMEVEASSSRKVSVKASTSKTTVEASSSTKRKVTASVDSKKQKKAKKGSDDEYSDEEIQMKVVGAPKARYADRKPGSFAMCAECNKKVGSDTNIAADIAEHATVHCHPLYQSTP